MSSDDLLAALPFLALAGGAALVVLLAGWLKADERSWMLLGAIVASGSLAAASLLGGGADGLGGLLQRDGASAFITVLVGGSALVTLLLEAGDRSYSARRGARASALILLSASGAVLMASAGDLVIVLAGLALLLVPLELLAAPHGGAGGVAARAPALRRAAIALVLFAAGTTLVFADVGSTRVGALGSIAAAPGQAGVALLLAALALAAAVVPFHLLAPETQATAPAPVVGFVAIVAKLGAFAALLRTAGAITASGVAEPDWRASIAVLAALTMVVGSLAALGRSSLRQMIAFLCVAQVGTLATALASGVIAGPPIAFGLAVLVLGTLGAYAVVAQLGTNDLRVDDLRGLARRRPLLAGALGLLMLGLAGLPPTAGFLAKVYVFEAAIGAQLAWLVIVGALTMVICAACSFRVLRACLGEGAPVGTTGGNVRVGVAIVAALAVLFVGMVPAPLLDAVQSVRF